MVKWEEIKTNSVKMERAKVPGGWLVMVHWNGRVSLTFYPDPNHKWDGWSLS
jgi:hypothetical protein